MRVEHDRAIERVYLGAMLGRVKKPPPLDKLLSRRKPKPMAWQDMLKAAEGWCASLK